MGLTTTKYALPYPVLADGPDGADVPYWIQLLANKLDITITSYDQGTFALRPPSSAGTPGKTGRCYYATDTTLLYYDFGTGWISVGAQPPWHTADYADASVTDAKIVGMDGSKLVGLSVPRGALAAKLIDASKIDDGLKPSVSASAATEALRALGTSAGQAMAGNQAAGGDLTGNYPNPTIAALAVTASKIALATITDAQVAAANKDGAAGTASMRTLGTGAQQAAPGNDSRFPVRAALKKTAAVTVNTTVAETDLLAGALDLAAGDLGTSRKAKIVCWGDMKNNSGAAVAFPRFKFKLGGTTIIDTGAPAAILSNDAIRRGWKIEIEILELGVTNAQLVTFDGKFSLLQAQAVGFSGNVTFTTGEGNWGGSEGPSGSPRTQIAEALGSNTAALDATTALAVVLSVINGSANANMETKLLGAVLEIV